MRFSTEQYLQDAKYTALQVPGIDPGTKAKAVNKVAVIGSGTMGGGIAINFLNVGIPVVLLDIDKATLNKGVGIIDANYRKNVTKGRLSEQQKNCAMALLATTMDYAQVADADLVIEAVVENIDIKTRVFQILDRTCKPETILATNTSTLDINLLAAATGRPESVLGLHFFSPANVMKLLEVVRAEKTSDQSLVTALSLAQQINKVPVVSGVCWGFIGNRMLESYGREAMRLILEGSSPVQIDKVLQDFGLAMGFPRMSDLAGIDVGYLIRQGRKEACYGRDPGYAAICDKLYELGRYGQKSGRGFYIYEKREGREDPEIEALATELAKAQGVTRRTIDDREILERCLYSLINEGAKVLQEGIAQRASDIDVVYCFGYGFPKARGGPMRYADETGLSVILTVLKDYQYKLGDYGGQWFTPAPLLENCVATGKCFADI